MDGKKLLVIDDDPDIGEFVRRVAEQLGYDVAVIDDPDSFEQLYGSFSPDVVVLDVVMPRLDGIEIIKYLAKTNSPSRLIVISGYSSLYLRNSTTLARDWGISSVTSLSKPIEIGDLESALLEAS